MIKRTLLLQYICIISLMSPAFGQEKLKDFNSFVAPVGNWLKADDVKMDAENTALLSFKEGGDCFVNGVDGSAKYLVSQKAYQDMEMNLEFMLPKGSNSGIYFQCRYEIQLFDSWGVEDITFYDCAGIHQRWDTNNKGEKIGIDGHAPRTNACKAPGEWQTLKVIFRAPTFSPEGEKLTNAIFEKVLLNGIVVHEDVEVLGPTKGALSETEVTLAPFRLQGGHGPVAFRNITVKDLMDN